MSYGDEIMATGHARVACENAKAKTGRVHKAVILGRGGKGARWSDMFTGISWIVQPREPWLAADTVGVINGPQCRPYISYPWNLSIPQRWTTWRARDHVGAVWIPTSVRQIVEKQIANVNGRPFILIEPSVSPKGNPNKQWGAANWQTLGDAVRDTGREVVTVGPQAQSNLRGAVHIQTPTFKHAVAVMEHATGAILPEGGLHHAAAAIGKWAVVLFGPCISEATTGYNGHSNIQCDDDRSPCGWWRQCDHCREQWKTITVDFVMSVVKLGPGGAARFSPQGTQSGRD